METYERAKTRYSVGDQEELRHIEIEMAASVAYDQECLAALRTESNLKAEQWDELIACLREALSTGLRPYYESLCAKFARMLGTAPRPPRTDQNFRRRPVGPKLTKFQRATFGRVVPIERLASYIADFTGQDRKDCLHTLQQLLLSGTVDYRSLFVLEWPLGKFLMWSLFDEHGHATDPFVPHPNSVADLLAEAGVSVPKNQHRKMFVLLSYHLPSTINPHFPTIVDAYAGFPNYYFRPLPLPATSGTPQVLPRTRPLPGYEETRGRPEAVHGVIFSSSLASAPKVRAYKAPI